MAARDNFRTNLATAITARRLRKLRLANDARIARPHLDRVLKGEVDPGLDTSERLAVAAGFTLSSLLESPEIFSAAVLTTVS